MEYSINYLPTWNVHIVEPRLCWWNVLCHLALYARACWSTNTHTFTYIHLSQDISRASPIRAAHLLVRYLREYANCKAFHYGSAHKHTEYIVNAHWNYSRHVKRDAPPRVSNVLIIIIIIIIMDNVRSRTAVKSHVCGKRQRISLHTSSKCTLFGKDLMMTN